MMRYIFLHIWRSKRFSLITLVCFFVVLFLITSIQQSVFSRQKMLDEMASNMEVECTVTNRSGMTEYIDLDSYYADLFLPGGYYDDYVRELRVKGSYRAWIPGKNTYMLCAITCEKAEKTFRNVADPIIYDTGYDESIFFSDEPVGVISKEIMEHTYEQDGVRYLDMVVMLESAYYGTSIEVPMIVRIIGTSFDSGRIYMPFVAFQRLHRESGTRSYYTVHSMSFQPVDNTMLDKLRFQIKSTFRDREDEIIGFNPRLFYLHINDTQYLKLIREAQRNLLILQWMQPVLYLCALGAGVMLVVMQMRGRKKEMAVIRSLGAGRLRVMAQSILEYALICLPVTLFALLVWRELSPMTVFGVWLAFMMGALCTIVRFSMIPLVKQIRELEE